MFLPLLASAQHNFREVVQKRGELAARYDEASWFEGFLHALEGQTIQYHSQREDCEDAFICRTTDGNMAVEWVSAPLPPSYVEDVVTYVVLAGIDLKKEQHCFDIAVNGVSRFEYCSGTQDEWALVGAQGGRVEFRALYRDHHGDVFGYLIFTIPASWTRSGAGTVFRVTGAAEGSPTWFMVFDCPDALAHLIHQASGEYWLEMSVAEVGNGLEIVLEGPAALQGQTVQLDIGTSPGFRGKFRQQGERAVMQSNIDASRRSLEGVRISISGVDHIHLVTPGIFTQDSLTLVDGDHLVQSSSTMSGPGIWQVDIEARYQPFLVRQLEAVSSGTQRPSTIYLMGSSHQDIAWMDSPQQCIIDRDELLISPTLELMKQHPEYRHDFEHVLMLREYLDRHPEKKDMIAALSREGKITWGASYNEPYEEMYNGEALVRQFYLGKRWLESQLPDVEANVYWNVDVPGRTLQMPQILVKAGVKYMMISRHEEGIFRWASPDGSSVATYSSSHYGRGRAAMKKGMTPALHFLATESGEWIARQTPSADSYAIPVMSSEDMSPPIDYSRLMQSWNNLYARADDQNTWKQLDNPRIAYATAEAFLDAYTAENQPEREIEGERPAVWLYIHGPSHHQAVSAGRAAGIVLPAAEKFAAIRALLAGSFDQYPQAELTRGWESAIYPDHGWGGKNGDITDSLFREKLEEGLSIGRDILRASIDAVASLIQVDSNQGFPLHVFNTLSWKRSDPVETDLDFKRGACRGFVLIDAEGNTVPYQVTDNTYYEDGSCKTVRIVFIAEDVPPLGYDTYFLKSAAKPLEIAAPESTEINAVESRFYRIELDAGGIRQLMDKSLNRPVFRTEKFLGGELFTMQSVGNGAGEFADIQQPDMEGFDKLSLHRPVWNLIEDGPVRAVVACRQPMKHTIVKQRIIVYKDLKRVDITADLLEWDGTVFREFRLAFPLNMENAKVTYEVPFGSVTVGEDEIAGAAGERYVTPCRDVRPRGIMNWIGASNDDIGFTMSSSVAVADYIDPTGNPVDYTMLQPVLLASRHSCHWEGLPYSQPGDHHYSFSITTHEPGRIGGHRFGVQANTPLQVVFNPSYKASAFLPVRHTFFAVEGDHVLVSTIKKCEDGDQVVIRLCDYGGKDQEVTVQSGFRFAALQRVNIIERPQGAIIPIGTDQSALQFHLGHHAIETYKLYQ
jgi:alpha-mannosidase